MTSDWRAAAQDQPEPSTSGGASSYFSEPEKILDPALFEKNVLRRQAHHKIVSPLFRFLRHLGLQGTTDWLKLWITGSGISYQWAADRGNGDLDVMIGIDNIRFRDANPEFTGFDDDDLAGWLNHHLKQGLWPETAETVINGKSFEVTYYYNPGTSLDISLIHPYAAYSLDDDAWVVQPPQLPHNPSMLYPKEWFTRSGYDKSQADEYVRRYHSASSVLNASPPGSPGYLNSASQLNLVTAQARALLDDIHHGRQAAFLDGGKGYSDYANFRWQAAKASGTVKALSELAGIRTRAIEDEDAKLYGGPLSAADELVRRAMLQRTRFE